MLVRRLLLIGAFLGLSSAVLAGAGAAPTDKVSRSQKAAALEYLAAVASGDPQRIALAIHPDDLLALRTRILGLLREEAKRDDSTIRARLFGQAMPLAEIERLTNTGLYAVLADKFYLAGREYSELEGLAAIADQDDSVEVVVRGRQPRDRGKVQVVNVVTIKPYGKDWKAALPSEIQAQIDDLIEARGIPTATVRSQLAPAGGVRPGSGTSPVQPGIVELLATAEKQLSDGRCADYYGRQMSPNFRRVTSKKALEALVTACQNSLGTRTTLLATLHIVRGLEPHYEFEGQRAIYNLAGQGLPFDQFVLEQVDKKWYVAE